MRLEVPGPQRGLPLRRLARVALIGIIVGLAGSCSFSGENQLSEFEGLRFSGHPDKSWTPEIPLATNHALQIRWLWNLDDPDAEPPVGLAVSSNDSRVAEVESLEGLSFITRGIAPGTTTMVVTGHDVTDEVPIEVADPAHGGLLDPVSVLARLIAGLPSTGTLPGPEIDPENASRNTRNSTVPPSVEPPLIGDPVWVHPRNPMHFSVRQAPIEERIPLDLYLMLRDDQDRELAWSRDAIGLVEENSGAALVSEQFDLRIDPENIDYEYQVADEPDDIIIPDGFIDITDSEGERIFRTSVFASTRVPARMRLGYVELLPREILNQPPEELYWLLPDGGRVVGMFRALPTDGRGKVLWQRQMRWKQDGGRLATLQEVFGVAWERPDVRFLVIHPDDGILPSAYETCVVARSTNIARTIEITPDEVKVMVGDQCSDCSHTGRQLPSAWVALALATMVALGGRRRRS